MDYPPPPPLQDPGESSMEHIFEPLKQQWVWDFFFESEHQEADMLQYAITDQFVTLAEFTVKTRETTDPYANRFQVGERHRVLLLPSFSTGALTCGFGVNERISSSSTFQCRERYTGRIVRDDEKGTSLFLSEDRNMNMVEVTWFNLFSPANREQVFALFQRKRFLEALASVKTEYDHDAVKDSLIYFYYAVEGRQCPNCGDMTDCKCKLLVTPKKHPLDGESEMRNVASYTGRYDGIASLGLYSNGNNVFLANYNAQSRINIHADFTAQQKLALWALCAAAQKREVNPLKLIMSEAAAMKNRVVTATDTFLLASLAESVMGDDQSDPAAETTSHASRGVASAVSNALSGHSPRAQVGFGSALAHITALAGSAGLNVNDFINDSRVLGDLSGMANGGIDLMAHLAENSATNLSESNPVSTAPSMSDDAQVSGCENVSSVGDVEMEDTADVVAAALASSEDETQPRGVTASQEGPGQQARPLAARPLLPLAPASGSAPEASDPAKATEIDEERRRKAELRKARNRESAHRSNQKRKMQIQKLKEEIDAAATREQYLRAKEKMLREENMSLRTAVLR